MDYTGCQQHSSSRHRQHKQISGVSSGCQQEDWDEADRGVHDFLSSGLLRHTLPREKHLHKVQVGVRLCFNKNFCTRCRAGFYLHLGKCQENCPEGLVRSDTQRECVPKCPAECESCVNSDTCTQCRPGLYQLSGRCHHVCPEDYEPNGKLMECTPQVHCEVGEWSEWSPCSKSGRTCGFKRGEETRTRHVLQYPSPLGKPCPEISEIKECLVKRRKCPGARKKNERRERRNRNNRKDKENQEGRRERKRDREREKERHPGEREDSDNRNKTEHRHRRGHDTAPVSPEEGLVQ
ncbi:unnamed protein product [Pleuronectes platessa]|uniref:R-spondin 3 n=1 Tax=Pleuronectes platessa TaxID=8262 RepID=A0A9N7VC93_PLEPL|nr:unnamed protein product [Pleuronectes platessa]